MKLNDIVPPVSQYSVNEIHTYKEPLSAASQDQSCGFTEEKKHQNPPLSSLFLALSCTHAHQWLKIARCRTKISALSLLSRWEVSQSCDTERESTAAMKILKNEGYFNNMWTRLHLQYYLNLLLYSSTCNSPTIWSLPSYTSGLLTVLQYIYVCSVCTQPQSSYKLQLLKLYDGQYSGFSN